MQYTVQGNSTMTNATKQQTDLPFNAPMIAEDDLESLRRAKVTLEAIFAECKAAGYDGSTTLIDFIKARLHTNSETGGTR
jgi:hypothetical protein